MSFIVRPMITGDLPAATALWSASEGVELAEGDQPADLERYLARNPDLSSVAVEGGELIGAVLCGHDGRRGLVYHLAVRKDRRGRGIGRELLQRSLGGLRDAGITRALLLVAADNDAGRAFWAREGWEELTFARPMGLDL